MGTLGSCHMVVTAAEETHWRKPLGKRSMSGPVLFMAADLTGRSDRQLHGEDLDGREQRVRGCAGCRMGGVRARPIRTAPHEVSQPGENYIGGIILADNIRRGSVVCSRLDLISGFM